MSFLFYVVLTIAMALASLLLFSLLDMAQKSEESLDRLELEILWIEETASPSRKGRTPMTFSAAGSRFVSRRCPSNPALQHTKSWPSP